MDNKKRFKFVVIFLVIMFCVCVYNSSKYYTATKKLNIVSTNLQTEIKKSLDLGIQLDMANATLYDLKNTSYELVYLGEYQITHYCAEKYEHICGTGSGKTATGTNVTPGRTIAVDPSVIPYGAQVYIEGYGFRQAEDCGGWVNGKHIDMAVQTHDEAISLGRNNTGVWMLVKRP